MAQLSALEEVENRAGLTRVTCGWKKPSLSLEWVRRYWRDVHSPAIARRAGVYDYRHYQFDPVRSGVLPRWPQIEDECPEHAQLMWVSDVRYLDEQALARFAASPDGQARIQLLADIELIVERSTTYRAVGTNAWTWLDATGEAAPQGPVRAPSFALFFRQRGEEAAFRASLRTLAVRWARTPGVRRVRATLFDVPDMEAERRAGYPVKTHPPEQQYQAWFDLVVENDAVAGGLLSGADGVDYPRSIAAIHAYPVRVVYTSVYAGRPTLVGLRGYAAHEAIEALGAANQKDPDLLEWMYGPVAGTSAPEADVP